MSTTILERADSGSEIVVQPNQHKRNEEIGKLADLMKAITQGRLEPIDRTEVRKRYINSLSVEEKKSLLNDIHARILEQELEVNTEALLAGLDELIQEKQPSLFLRDLENQKNKQIRDIQSKTLATLDDKVKKLEEVDNFKVDIPAFNRCKQIISDMYFDFSVENSNSLSDVLYYLSSSQKSDANVKKFVTIAGSALNELNTKVSKLENDFKDRTEQFFISNNARLGISFTDAINFAAGNIESIMNFAQFMTEAQQPILKSLEDLKAEQRTDVMKFVINQLADLEITSTRIIPEDKKMQVFTASIKTGIEQIKRENSL
jgi:hypothetical protein